METEMSEQAANRFIIAIVVAIFLTLLFFVALTSGCISPEETEQIKTGALDAISPVVVLKGSAQYEKQYPSDKTNVTESTITIVTEETTLPVETIQTLPTAEVHITDPYAQGERWQGQWFKITHKNLVENTTVNLGVIVYKHAYMDQYSYYKAGWGQYFIQKPPVGMRYCVVWIHEELFSDSPIWYFGNQSFHLQYENRFLPNDPDYNIDNRILELTDIYNYYHIESTSPFGFKWVRIPHMLDADGHYVDSGGYYAKEIGDLYQGQGNAIDGYIIYLVPITAKDSDLMLVGEPGGFGQAYWRFDNDWMKT